MHNALLTLYILTITTLHFSSSIRDPSDSLELELELELEQEQSMASPESAARPGVELERCRVLFCLPSS